MNRMAVSLRCGAASAAGLGVPRGLRAQAVFLREQLGRHRVAEVGGLEDLADLDLAFLERAALDPFDGFFLPASLFKSWALANNYLQVKKYLLQFANRSNLPNFNPHPNPKKMNRRTFFQNSIQP